MTTRAVRDGSNWVLNGEKTWITNGSMADVAFVWARTDDGIRGFLVERGTPGFSTSDIHGKWSMRASVTSSLAFSDCRVARFRDAAGRERTERPAFLPLAGPARHRLGSDRRGDGLLRNRPAYVTLRKQFDDRPLASHQLVQEKLAWMITEITKAQLLALQCGRLKDAANWSRRTFPC